MRTNTAVQNKLVTHEGARAHAINPKQELRRSVMSCMLWEKEFYEDGVFIADRIASLVPKVTPSEAGIIADEARHKMKLRHVPMLVVREMVRTYCKGMYTAGAGIESVLPRILQRADEPAEFLALYWKDGKQPLPHAVRRGLATALTHFDEYDFGKYRGEGNKVSLRDVFRMVRPKPANAEQAELWRKVVKGELATPDTWEVALSANDGLSKRDKWTRLLVEGKLGALALLRNLRNMQQEGVDKGFVVSNLRGMNVKWVLPFRFIAAARAVPELEGALEEAFIRSFAGGKKLDGKTTIMVDVSSSMDASLSAKSDMTRMDAACGVAMVAREMFSDVSVYSFSNYLKEVPARRGFSLRDAINHSQSHSGTELGKAYGELPKDYERLIIITDEQSHDKVAQPVVGKNYIINVGSYKNGVGYGSWLHIDGFSEAVFNYIAEVETASFL